MSAGSPLWYLSRGFGVVSLVLLTLVVTLGVLTRGGRPLPGLARFAVAGLHRNLSLVAVGLLVLHVVTAIVDPYVTIGWTATVVPFVSSYHPLELGLGTLSLDLMIVLVVSSLLRQVIGQRTWRAIHWAAYACWPVALLHGITMGPDTTSGPLLWLTLGCTVLALGSMAWRLYALPRGNDALPVVTPVAALRASARTPVTSGAHR